MHGAKILNHLTKKRILISSEQQKSAVGCFFSEVGLELCSEFKEEELSEYLFIVDDYLEELKILPRIQTKKRIESSCLSNVRGFFDEKFISEERVKSLLGSYLCGAQDFDLVESFSKDFKSIFTLKIHDYLNIGYFIDTIVVEAYKNKFDYEQVRNYLNFALRYSLKLVEQEESQLPLDVSYSCSEAGFVVQIALGAKSLDMNKDFHSKSEELRNFSANANYFDASYFTKKGRLFLSSLWFKEENLQSFKSFFFTETGERQNRGEMNSVLINRLDENLESVQYETSVSSLDQSKKLYLARKYSHFIRNFRKDEESPPELNSLTVDDIDKYLSHYPKQEIFLPLDLETKKFMIKLLTDDNLEEGITGYIQKISKYNLNKHIDGIQRLLTRTPLGEMNVIAQIKEQAIRIESSGRNIVEDDIVQIVSSQMNADPEEARTLVKGFIEEVICNSLIKKERLDEASVLHFISEPPRQVQSRDKLESQIKRMKILMEQMRTEIVKLRTETEASHGGGNPIVNDPQNTEILNLKKALARTLEMLKGKENVSLKQKIDYEQALEVKESSQQHLEARLELANQKIITISENMDKTDSDNFVKKDKELLSLKTNIQFAHALIIKLKEERTDFQNKLSEERERYNKLKEEKAAEVNLPKDQVEKDLLLVNLQSEKKLMEEKFRAQGMELKKIEQKLKFITAQLDESQKRKTQSSAALNKSNEIYIKQLENASARIEDANNEMSEKKKEMFKLKQENALLVTKVSELEKKLSNHEKKAA